jgi:cytochrome bd-type quinol oxidase subunit 2
MQRVLVVAFGYAFLGVVVGAGIPLTLHAFAPIETYEVANWVDDRAMNPLVGVLLFSITCGGFLGALTGFASAFSRRKFAAARCLLAITIPGLLAGAFVTPRNKQEMAEMSMWTPYVVGAMTAIVMAVSLAYLGQRRTRKAPLSVPPTPPMH